MMKNIPENQWKQGTKYLLLIAFLLFVGRFCYLQVIPNGIQIAPWYEFQNQSEFVSGVVQEAEFDSAPSPPPQQTEQKFSQNADYKSVATDYTSDKQKAQSLFEKYETKLRYEQESGIVGQRMWTVRVDVVPQKFATLNQNLATVGKLSYRNVRKVDETRNFVYLNERIAVAEKKLSAFKGLDIARSSVDEKIKLIDKISEIEADLEQMRGSKTRYEGANGLCVIEFTLSEETLTNHEPSWTYLLFLALEWTLFTLIYSMLIILLFATFLYLIGSIVNKIKDAKGN